MEDNLRAMRRRLVLTVLSVTLGLGACTGDADEVPTPSSATTPQDIDGSGQTPVDDREVRDSETPGPAGNPNPS